MWFFLSIVVVLFHYFSTESREVPSHSEGPFFSTNRCSSRSVSLIVSRPVVFPGIGTKLLSPPSPFCGFTERRIMSIVTKSGTSFNLVG
ncbi:hypothetical protein KC19_2G075900 [Ceratodon purpureus]|uniref:Secreted protein n=1 Tax=Ceratodon purpureus TaxID=3225 RepID=A0A8T0IV54_CERPU|nr:hypothetical protein KC19_2G075900 [Ceratodon purpureus]